MFVFIFSYFMTFFIEKILALNVFSFWFLCWSSPFYDMFCSENGDGRYIWFLWGENCSKLAFYWNRWVQKNFFTKYFRVEYLISTNNVVVAGPKAAEDDEQAFFFFEKDDILVQEARWMVILLPWSFSSIFFLFDCTCMDTFIWMFGWNLCDEMDAFFFPYWGIFILVLLVVQWHVKRKFQLHLLSLIRVSQVFEI